MKNLEWLRRSGANAQRSFRRQSKIYSVLAFMLLGASGCEMIECTDGPEPVNFCGTMPTEQTCNTYATAETVICGAGVWANVWLRLDDGTLLQPWENHVQGMQLVNGQRYKIGYEFMQRDNRFQNAVICLAVPPASQAARIFCLETDDTATHTDAK